MNPSSNITSTSPSFPKNDFPSHPPFSKSSSAKKIEHAEKLVAAAKNAQTKEKAAKQQDSQALSASPASASSSTHPTVAIQAIFDEAANAALVKKGTLRLANRFPRPEITIELLAAGSKSPPGFGTAAIRTVVKASLENGDGGQFYCSADYSSHLFYLKMGMIPRNITSQIGSTFIFTLLGILEHHRKTQLPNTHPRPDTRGLTSVMMEMSEEGLKEWVSAIQQKRAFQPFRNLVQLRPFMAADDLKRLDALLIT